MQPFPALADPPLPTPFTITQPDGTTFVVRVWGDEHSNGLETTDGFTILQEPGSGIIIWPATTIGVSSGITRTFQVTVSATITNGNKLTNVVSVTAAQGITIDNQMDIEMVGGG